jgi:hypothetical protein
VWLDSICLMDTTSNVGAVEAELAWGALGCAKRMRMSAERTRQMARIGAARVRVSVEIGKWCGVDKRRSRFRAGMTERKANASATTKAGQRHPALAHDGCTVGWVPGFCYVAMTDAFVGAS